jgi:hypothetical protein
LGVGGQNASLGHHERQALGLDLGLEVLCRVPSTTDEVVIA